MKRGLFSKESVTTLIELAGFGFICCAVWRVSETAGLIAVGVALLIVGFLA